MRSDAISEAPVATPQRTEVALGSGAASERRLRRRALANLLRMGHCAPTIMQTAIDAAGLDAPWLVKLLGAMPGGIGNSGGECGGVTAPLVLLGLKHRNALDADGVPIGVKQGKALLQRFAAAEGTTACEAIRGDARVPLRCIGVIRRAPVLAARCLAMAHVEEAPPAEQQAHARCFAHWRAENFHCAHAVLHRLAPEVEVTDDLLAATSGFVGGTAMAGLTCSAVAAGVLALGLVLAEIEDSRVRVVRMIATMAATGDAFADHMNRFNRVMNRGHRMARECHAEFGSIQCRRLTGCDLGKPSEVQHYIEQRTVERCRQVVDFVVARVRKQFDEVAVSRGVVRQAASTGARAIQSGPG